MTAALLGLFGWAKGGTETARLWRSVLLFASCDAFFSGLALAYAFALFAVPGVLGFIAVQQILSLTGHVLGYRLLRHFPAQQVMRSGVVAFSLALVCAGLLPHGLPALAALACLGGLARGWAWGSRLWQEMHLEPGAGRQAYFGAAEGANILVKLVAPLLAAALLWCHVEVQGIFLVAGLVVFPLAAVLAGKKAERLPAPGRLEPWALMCSVSYWRTAPFYVLDGMAHALRTALFVSGALVVVGSVAGYSLVESFASLVALALLAWQAHRAKPGPSLSHLKRYLLVMALAWTCLLMALWSPWFLLPYVVLFGIGQPLASTQKTALTIQGMTSGSGSRESNAMARSLLLVASRLGCLGLCLGIAQLTASPEQAVAGMAILGVLLLPLEYFFARRLAKV